jgi:hypothetical protein
MITIKILQLGNGKYIWKACHKNGKIMCRSLREFRTSKKARESCYKYRDFLLDNGLQVEFKVIRGHTNDVGVCLVLVAPVEKPLALAEREYGFKVI